MKQYCRYCVYLVGNNGIYCEYKGKFIKKSTAKSLNNCKGFEFCEIDAFGETGGYKPRKRRTKEPQNNISLFDM